MKKTYLFGAATVAATLFALSLQTNSVSAATGSDPSTATFSVTGGTDADLTLDQTPDFTFGPTTQKAIESADKAKGLDLSSTEDAGTVVIKVTDGRGSGAGWTLNGTLSAFTTGDDATVSANSLSFDTAITGANVDPDNASSSVKLTTGSETNTLSEAATFGQLDTTETLSNIKLNLPQSFSTAAGDYSGTVTWNLGTYVAPTDADDE